MNIGNITFIIIPVNTIPPPPTQVLPQSWSSEAWFFCPFIGCTNFLPPSYRPAHPNFTLLPPSSSSPVATLRVKLIFFTTNRKWDDKLLLFYRQLKTGPDQTRASVNCPSPALSGNGKQLHQLYISRMTDKKRIYSQIIQVFHINSSLNSV